MRMRTERNNGRLKENTEIRKGRGIEPEIQITDKLLFMNGNEQGIQRIFQNIIKNGLDHGEKKISISLEEVENNIRIQIKNQVCHVEKINVDQVFERFYLL